MTDNSHRTLERIAGRVPIPEPAYERLLRRRERKGRNRRMSAAVLAIVLTLLSIAALIRAFGNAGRPATEPTPVDTGIFSGLGGWIAYGNGYLYGNFNLTTGIWAMDPERRGIQKQLSTRSGEPLAWSSDGTKLLILRQTGRGFTSDSSLYVLNADGSETLLIDARCGYCLSGGSFSPDGSKVVYASGAHDENGSGIYVIEAAGGTPRLLPQPLGGPYDAVLSPDGSQIAYFAGGGDHDNTLRVVNADGGGAHVLLRDAGMMATSAGLRYLAWSPDGTRLTFEMGYGPFSIYVVGAVGSGLTRLIANGVHPAWSPDGSRIAYNLPTPTGSGRLRIADADGTHARGFDYAASGAWNPLARADSSGKGTTATPRSTSPDARNSAVAALAANGILMLWLRRKRKKQDAA